MDKIIITVVGVAGIVFTYWFFLMRRQEKVRVTADSVDITVEGGYSPEIITIPQGKKTVLYLTRKDPSNCLEEIVIPQFKVRRYLPLHERVMIEITPQEKGEFDFACGMNMFHGKIIVQ